MLSLTLVAARMFVVFVLLAAGIGKLIDPFAAAASWGTLLGATEHTMVAFFRFLSVLEIATAGDLVVRRDVAASYVAVALSAVFFGLSILRNVGVLEVAHCGCFGLLNLGPNGPAEVARDGLLLVGSLLLVIDESGPRRQYGYARRGRTS